jgi:hypothetical protein
MNVAFSWAMNNFPALVPKHCQWNSSSKFPQSAASENFRRKKSQRVHRGENSLLV